MFVSDSTNADRDLPASGDSTTAGSAKKGLAVNIALYTGARMLLVLVIAAVIFGAGFAVGVQVPILVAAVFGVLISLPLSLVMFKNLRIRVNESIAEVDADRRAARADLQSKLRGEDGQG